MLNEWTEFLAYTEPVHYAAAGKRDASYLGRFTFDTLLDFEGLTRVLTILARGCLFHAPDGEPLPGEPRERLAEARRALCAWCSVPDGKKATPREAWQFKSDFSELCGAFPKLVDEAGGGWFFRHVHSVIKFVARHPGAVSKSAQGSCEKLRSGFDRAWRSKVLQLQTPIFASATKGQWLLRFDDVLADALELGPLRQNGVALPPELAEKLKAVTPASVPADVVATLVAYYIENKPEDSDWVILPVSSFDAYFGTTSFGRKYLKVIPPEIIERSDSGFGVSRYRVRASYLPS